MTRNKQINGVIFSLVMLAGICRLLRDLLFEPSTATLFEGGVVWWLIVIEDIGWSGALLVAFSYGTFLLRDCGVRCSLKYIAVGGVGFLLTAGMAAWALNAIQTMDLGGLSPIMKVSAEMAYADSTLPTETRHKVTRIYAQTVFAEEGNQIQYIGAHGDMVTFEPEANDLLQRDSIIRTKQQYGWLVQSLKNSLILTITLVLLSIVTGLVVFEFYKRRTLRERKSG